MTHTPFVGAALREVGACPVPSRCPYCPAGTLPHWSRWGHYERYAGDPQDPSRKMAVARWRCKVVVRTFSLLPDALLPHCSVRTGTVLEWLHVLHVEEAALSRVARCLRVARGTLRALNARFLHVVAVLRLPNRQGAVGAAAFLEALATMKPTDLVALFRDWKECEPKHSVVGIYARPAPARS